MEDKEKWMKAFTKTLYDLHKSYLESCEGDYDKPEIEPTFRGFVRFVADKVPWEYKQREE